jgi:hypothetical protein
MIWVVVIGVVSFAAGLLAEPGLPDCSPGVPLGLGPALTLPTGVGVGPLGVGPLGVGDAPVAADVGLRLPVNRGRTPVAEVATTTAPTASALLVARSVL